MTATTTDRKSDTATTLFVSYIDSWVIAPLFLTLAFGGLAAGFGVVFYANAMNGHTSFLHGIGFILISFVIATVPVLTLAIGSRMRRLSFKKAALEAFRDLGYTEMRAEGNLFTGYDPDRVWSHYELVHVGEAPYLTQGRYRIVTSRVCEADLTP